MATSYVVNSNNMDKHKTLSKSFSTPASQMSAIPRVIQRPPLNRSLTRTESIKQSISSGTANFFGIPGSSDHQYSMQKWANRRMRHCSRRYGPIKEYPSNEIMFDAIDSNSQVVQTPLLPEAHQIGDGAESGISVDAIDGRSLSIDTRTARRNTLTRRDSVAKMAWDGLLSSIVKSPARKRHPGFRKARPSRSFSPSVVVAASTDSVFESEPVAKTSLPATPIAEFPPPAAAMSTMNMTVIPENLEEATDGVPFRDQEIRPRRSTMKATRPHEILKRSQTPATDTPASPLQDDVFFDITPLSSVPHTGTLPAQAWPFATPAPSNVQFALHYPPRIHDFVRDRSDSQESTIVQRNLEAKRKFLEADQVDSPRSRFEFDRQPPSVTRMTPLDPADQRRRQFPTQGGPVPKERLTLNNIWSRIVVATALNNSNRRVLGEGVVGRFFGRTLKTPSDLPSTVLEKLDDIDDYRPFFTYWVTSVQVLVLIISLALFGFGPFGFGRTQYSAMVLQTSLVLEQVPYFEKENFWIGPRFADLVHLGAKYSPCMRRDKKIFEVIDEMKTIENDSACCIRNDRTGCVQTTKKHCPSLLAVWHKWNGTNNPEHRVSGSVCNQDPRECKKPASAIPFKWPDDITKWPICKETNLNPREIHTKCEITGRPCCIGIVGQCNITTREYCDFVRGYFHEEATLCSQVSCLGEVCGMIPFVSPEYPNQFYRLFISIFLHAGILHVVYTILVQFIFMRDLEKLIGWFRLSIIYLGSGIAGNLASAVFVPYETEVGPAGCHFGLLAALFVDAIVSWKFIVKPWKALLQLGVVLILLLIVGLLPWVDNWAHTFGFIFGLLLSFALFPYIQVDEHDRRKRIIVVVTSLLVSIGLFALLLILFYFIPLWECKNCVYFNCIPFTDHFCDNHGLSLVPLPF